MLDGELSFPECTQVMSENGWSRYPSGSVLRIGSVLGLQFIMFHNSVSTEVSGVVSQCPSVFDRSLFGCLKCFQGISDFILHEQHTLMGSNTSVALISSSPGLCCCGPPTSGFVIITSRSLTSGFYCLQTIESS